MIDRTYLRRITQDNGIFLEDTALERLDLYAQLLTEWNEKINLTAITEPEEICVKHFLDSLLLLRKADLPQQARLIDVGTGAGFPGVPCALARPDLRLTLLDSLQKRVVFLQALTAELAIPADCLHARAEEAGRDPALREQFDCATARAVAHLRELSEYCLPFVKVGGCFAALKGGDVAEELSQSRQAIRLLGGQVEAVETYTLPDGSARSLICIRKISQCSTKFPRTAAKMKKQPL